MQKMLQFTLLLWTCITSVAAVASIAERTGATRVRELASSGG